jgi:hypothetical protein
MQEARTYCFNTSCPQGAGKQYSQRCLTTVHLGHSPECCSHVSFKNGQLAWSRNTPSMVHSYLDRSTTAAIATGVTWWTVTMVTVRYFPSMYASQWLVRWIKRVQVLSYWQRSDFDYWNVTAQENVQYLCIQGCIFIQDTVEVKGKLSPVLRRDRKDVTRVLILHAASWLDYPSDSCPADKHQSKWSFTCGILRC